ncbi:MAG: hypothetical protein QXZ43_01570 [Candidatus Aenigmatarchaeota archaeon]
MFLNDSEHKLAEAFDIWKQKSFMRKIFWNRKNYVYKRQNNSYFSKIKHQGYAEKIIKFLNNLKP